jgi:DNA repair protein RadC
MTIPINKVTIESALDIYEIMKRVLKREHKLDRDKEHFWVMALNKANKIVNLELVAFGANNRVKSRPADILAIPLQKQAQRLILIHNQPSGILKPSQEDKDFIDKIIKACELVKTLVIDYVIITEHSYFSCADTGLLEQLEASTKYLLSYELERKLHEELQAAREEIEQESKIKIKASLKKGEEKGLKKGLEEGEKKGIAEGRAEGLKEGEKKGIKKEKLEIAKQMLAKGLDIELICEMTGLSKQRICSL